MRMCCGLFLGTVTVNRLSPFYGNSMIQILCPVLRSCDGVVDKLDIGYRAGG